MRNLVKIVFGSLIGANIAAKAAGSADGISSDNLSVKILNFDSRTMYASGISIRAVSEEFLRQTGINLIQNEQLKVTWKNEGKDINFTTIDKVSITVSVNVASGVGNKTLPMDEFRGQQ